METQTLEKEWSTDKYAAICHHCKKFVKFSMYDTKEILKMVLVFKSPNGDQDNEYADITYNVTHIVCPYCQTEKELKRGFYSENNRRKITF